MTKRTIMEMAREAGLHLATDVNWMSIIGLEYAERFAALVREDERNRTWTQQHWTEYERSIAAAEREECAKVCDGFNFGQAPMMIQRAIRSRGQA